MSVISNYMANLSRRICRARKTPLNPPPLSLIDRVIIKITCGTVPEQRWNQVLCKPSGLTFGFWCRLSRDAQVKEEIYASVPLVRVKNKTHMEN